MGKYSIQNLSRISHENEILVEEGSDWTSQTPSGSGPAAYSDRSSLTISGVDNGTFDVHDECIH